MQSLNYTWASIYGKNTEACGKGGKNHWMTDSIPLMDIPESKPDKKTAWELQAVLWVWLSLHRNIVLQNNRMLILETIRTESGKPQI